MIKFTKLLAIAVMVLSCLSASAIEVKFKVSTADAVSFSYYENGTPVTGTLEVGENSFDVSSYTTITFTGIEPYEITGVTNSSGTPESVYGGMWYKTVYTNDENQVYTIAVKNIDEARTASCTLTVDDPSKVSAQYGGTNKNLTLTAGTQTVKFDPVNETSLYLSANSSVPFYKVTVDGATVSNSSTYGYPSYQVPLTQGCNIEVVTEIPQVPITVTIQYADEASEGALSSVYVNDTAVEDFDGTSVTMMAGDSFGMMGNAQYKFEEVRVNGAEDSWTGTYRWSKTFIEDATIYIKAHQYGKIQATVIVDNPQYMTLYRGYSYQNDIITLESGENTIEVMENNALIEWKISDNCYFSTPVTWNGEELGSYTAQHTVKEGDVFVFNVSQILLDKKAAVYVNDMSLADYYFNFANSAHKTMSENFTNGYNVIDFYDGNNPFYFNYAASTDLNTNVYVNDEIQEDYYGGYQITLADCDVVKIFFDDEPALCEVTFDVEENLTPTVVRDVVKVMDDLGEVSVLAGTQFNITSENLDIKVSVNDEDLTPSDSGNYQFTVNDPTTVKIKKQGSNGIADIESDSSVSPVYNLQGICVGNDTDNLPAGVYISNGKKVIVK